MKAQPVSYAEVLKNLEPGSEWRKREYGYNKAFPGTYANRRSVPEEEGCCKTKGKTSRWYRRRKNRVSVKQIIWTIVAVIAGIVIYSYCCYY